MPVLDKNDKIEDWIKFFGFDRSNDDNNTNKYEEIIKNNAESEGFKYIHEALKEMTDKKELITLVHDMYKQWKTLYEKSYDLQVVLYQREGIELLKQKIYCINNYSICKIFDNARLIKDILNANKSDVVLLKDLIKEDDMHSELENWNRTFLDYYKPKYNNLVNEKYPVSHHEEFLLKRCYQIIQSEKNKYLYLKEQLKQDKSLQNNFDSILDYKIEGCDDAMIDITYFVKNYYNKDSVETNIDDFFTDIIYTSSEYAEEIKVLEDIICKRNYSKYSKWDGMKIKFENRHDYFFQKYENINDLILRDDYNKPIDRVEPAVMPNLGSDDYIKDKYARCNDFWLEGFDTKFINKFMDEINKKNVYRVELSCNALRMNGNKYPNSDNMNNREKINCPKKINSNSCCIIL